MDRSQAEQALGIIRQVIQNTREDLIAHNWGLIWIIHSFTNFAGTACGTLIDDRKLPVYWYFTDCPYRWLPLLKEKLKGRISRSSSTEAL